MDDKKINSQLILLLIVAVIVFGIAVLCRLFAITAGLDVGTANLIFIGVIAVCGVVYLIIRSALSDVVLPWIMNKLPNNGKSIGNTEISDKPEAMIVEGHIEVDHEPINIAELREDASRNEIERIQNSIKLFCNYAHIVIGIYLPDNEIAKLDKCIERYALGQDLTPDIIPLHPKQLTNADLFHFGWNMHNYFNVCKQVVIVTWLKEMFHQLEDLQESTIAGKLKHSERATYLIPIEEDIPAFMAGRAK